MSSPLPTLNDMLDPDKKQAPQPNEKVILEESKETQPAQKEEEEILIKEEVQVKKEEEKKEEIHPPQEEKPKEEEKKKEETIIHEIKIEEEPKKEEKKEEEVKKEEKKEEGPKIEEEPKKEKKAPKKPREPEPEIPSDFSELIKELNEIKSQGNELFKKKEYDEAISKYMEGYEKLEKELPKINHERSYNPQSEELLTLSKQIMSNLSLCYIKTEKYQESVDLDLKIISIDPKYDKSYVRLFNAYIKLGKKEQAVYFGDILLKFDDETKKKYENVIPDINNAKNELQAMYDAKRAEERKQMLKSFAKYAIPVVVLLAAIAIYFFVIKKKRLPK